MFPDLHGRSHGESFLTLIESRFGRPGLYVMDEPESAQRGPQRTKAPRVCALT